MSTFWTIWLLVCIFDFGLGWWTTRWIERQDPSKDGISLSSIFYGTLISVCPIVNIPVACLMIVFFLSEIAPRIKFHPFGKK